MPSWNAYRLSCDPTKKEREEHGIDSPVEIDDDFMKRVKVNIEEELKKDRDNPYSIEFFTAFIENYWYFTGKPVVFVESSGLVDILLSTEYKSSFEDIRLPVGAVSFSFPDDTKINGIKVPPVIFSKMITNGGATTFFLIVRECFGKCKMMGISNQRQLEQLFSTFVDGNDEVGLNCELFKLCVRLCTYISAFPKSMRNGFPCMMKSRDSRIFQIDFNKIPPATLSIDSSLNKNGVLSGV